MSFYRKNANIILLHSLENIKLAMQHHFSFAIKFFLFKTKKPFNDYERLRNKFYYSISKPDILLHNNITTHHAVAIIRKILDRVFHCCGKFKEII